MAAADPSRALLFAVRYENPDEVKALIDSGARVDPGALQEAVGRDPKIMELLLSKDIDVNVLSDVLGFAIDWIKPQIQIIDLLLKKGVHVENGQALLRAIEKKVRLLDRDVDVYLPDIVERLLKAGSNPNVINESGSPALHRAILKDARERPRREAYFKIAKLLLAYDANPLLLDGEGRTAFDLLDRIRDNEEMRLLLLSAPALTNEQVIGFARSPEEISAVLRERAGKRRVHAVRAAASVWAAAGNNNTRRRHRHRRSTRRSRNRR